MKLFTHAFLYVWAMVLMATAVCIKVTDIRTVATDSANKSITTNGRCEQPQPLYGL